MSGEWIPQFRYPMATTTLMMPPTAPPFLSTSEGGYALAYVVEWQRLPSGEVKITLAVNDADIHGYPVTRTKLLSPADAPFFLAAIDEIMGDHAMLAAVTAERDAALKRCVVLEAAMQALHAQRVASQAKGAPLETERNGGDHATNTRLVTDALTRHPDRDF